MIMVTGFPLHETLITVTLPIAMHYQLPEMWRHLLLLPAVYSNVTMFRLLLACGFYVIPSMNTEQACSYAGWIRRYDRVFSICWLILRPRPVIPRLFTNSFFSRLFYCSFLRWAFSILIST
jgi:hypothetical protein